MVAGSGAAGGAELDLLPGGAPGRHVELLGRDRRRDQRGEDLHRQDQTNHTQHERPPVAQEQLDAGVEDLPDPERPQVSGHRRETLLVRDPERVRQGTASAPKSAERTELIALWTAALDRLANDKTLSQAGRIWATRGKVALARLDNKDGTLADFRLDPSTVVLPPSRQILLQTLDKRADLSAGIISGRRVAEEALELLAAPNCPSGRMDVLLAPDQMVLQIHESIGHPLELDRILGDERNFAGTSFVTPEMFGTYRYGSEQLNITFDPTRREELASYAFDDEGTPAEKTWLIRNGILERPLGGAISQARAGLAGVASARAESRASPVERTIATRPSE